MKKYFFFDIDGTLFAGKPGRQILPESTAYTIRRLQEKGHFVAIATGRSYAMAEAMMKGLGLVNMVHDGGNGITINGELIEVKPLDRDLCLKLIAECEEKGYPWAFSPENRSYRLAPDHSFMAATNDDYIETIEVADLNMDDYPEIHKMYIACVSPEEEKLEALKELPWCRYHDSYFFVEPTDKSQGIRRIMEYFKAPLEDVVVFGDDLNDLTMFSREWTSIAMGNAKEELKKKADYVTSDVLDDGIYKACRHYGWIE